jgi:hypothetical protein
VGPGALPNLTLALRPDSLSIRYEIRGRSLQVACADRRNRAARVESVETFFGGPYCPEKSGWLREEPACKKRMSSVREVDANYLNRLTDECGRIRALIMNLSRCISTTDEAHLVAGEIERIHGSLDRIEAEGSPYVERRRPNRAEYANPHLVGLLRQSTEARSESGKRRSDQWGRLEITAPTNKNQLELT